MLEFFCVVLLDGFGVDLCDVELSLLDFLFGEVEFELGVEGVDVVFFELFEFVLELVGEGVVFGVLGEFFVGESLDAVFDGAEGDVVGFAVVVV